MLELLILFWVLGLISDRCRELLPSGPAARFPVGELPDLLGAIR
jgi:hypothetical protein